MFSILTYNVEFGQQLKDILPWLLNIEPLPEILCFQEFPEHKIPLLHKTLDFLGYDAYFTSAFVYKKHTYGELIAFRKKIFHYISHRRVELGPQVWENRAFDIDSNRSALVVEVRFDEHILDIVNLHIPWLGSNSFRLKLLTKVVSGLSPDHKTIIVGDFNYTSLWGKQKLIQFMKKHDLTLANDGMLTHEYLGIFHQLDYVFYHKLLKETSEVFRVPYSDHFPVVTTFY
jgi:endonuclease/exonuclease/phosphatase family metal-dependent hydrolase